MIVRDLQYIEDRSIKLPWSGCWIWTQCVAHDGYGWVKPSRVNPFHRAHRLAYWIAHGEIPEGLGVLHRCSIKLCVNPGHLYAGTQADNVRDALAAGVDFGHWRGKLMWGGLCKHGHDLTAAGGRRHSGGCAACYENMKASKRAERSLLAA